MFAHIASQVTQDHLLDVLKQLFGKNGRDLEDVPIFRQKCY